MSAQDDSQAVADLERSARARELRFQIGEQVRRLQVERSMFAEVQCDLEAQVQQLDRELGDTGQECEELAARLQGCQRRLGLVRDEIAGEEERRAVRENELSTVDRHIDRLGRETEALFKDFGNARVGVRVSRRSCQGAVGTLHRMDHKMRIASGEQELRHGASE